MNRLHRDYGRILAMKEVPTYRRKSHDHREDGPDYNPDKIQMSFTLYNTEWWARSNNWYYKLYKLLRVRL
jgi:hypothetical protein